VVVTRHIGHDGLLVRPQGVNDVCPGNGAEGAERAREEERKHRGEERERGRSAE
jgi:hypothetical protein